MRSVLGLTKCCGMLPHPLTPRCTPLCIRAAAEADAAGSSANGSAGSSSSDGGSGAGAAGAALPVTGDVVEYPLGEVVKQQLLDGRTHGVALIVGRNMDRWAACGGLDRRFHSRVLHKSS